MASTSSLNAAGRDPRRRGGPAPALAGVLWMLAGMSGIGVVDGVAKVLARDLHGIQIAWGYFVIMLAGLVLAAAASRIGARKLLRTARPALQAARAACLVMSLSCLFYSLRHLPLAAATTIGFTAPLFIVALSRLLLRERVGWRRWAAVAAGLTGALIVVRPGLGILHWSAAVTLTGAFFFALFNIVTRLLGARDGPLTTLFYTFSIGTVLLSPAVLPVWTDPTTPHLVLFVLSGAVGLFAHFAIVRSLALADASAVAPLNYVRLLWAVGIGLAVFGELPDAPTFAGGALIVASGVYVIRSAGR